MKLLVAISGHGFGHLAQTAPVLNALSELVPDLSLTLWTDLPEAVLIARIASPFQWRREAADIGLRMRDAVTVDVDASLRAYLDFHAAWDERVATEADWLEGYGFDAVFSDVAYLPLAAAARIGIPGIALCSLNWFDILRAYLPDTGDLSPVFGQIQAAYRSARVFLRATPALPMSWLDRSEAVPAIATLGRDQSAALLEMEGMEGVRRVLVAFGGIGYRDGMDLPALPGVVWLLSGDDVGKNGKRGDVIAIEPARIPFLDLLASCDALLTKVGYGAFVEAAAHAKPVLYVDRPDWPETPWLRDWIADHGRAEPITESLLYGEGAAEAVSRRLERLWTSVPRCPASADGAAHVAMRIVDLIRAD